MMTSITDATHEAGRRDACAPSAHDPVDLAVSLHEQGRAAYAAGEVAQAEPGLSPPTFAGTAGARL
jgi:hypothetical protein